MPTKLTPETQKLLVEAIAKGLRSKGDICGYAGITSATLNVWQKAAAGDTPDPAAVALFEALETAKAARKVLYLRRMQRAGRDDWKMWREMLALVDPEEYGKQATLPIEMSGKVQMEDVTLDDAGRAARIAALLDKARARRDGPAPDDGSEGEAMAGDSEAEPTGAAG